MIEILTKEHKEKIKYLRQLKSIDKDIDRNILELNKWKNRASSITPILSDMPRGSGISDKIGDCVANIADLDIQINKNIDKLVDLKNEILSKIDAINGDTQDIDKYKNILKDRYISYMAWEELAYKNNYTWQHCYRLHEKALDLLKM